MKKHARLILAMQIKMGNLDIVEGDSEQRSYVFLGNDNGGFKEIWWQKDLKDNTYNIEIGDLNNDGYPDIIESNSSSWNLYYLTRLKQLLPNTLYKTQ